MDQHKVFMQRALALARQGQGYTSPNPAVGAVVVKEGRIVGEGYHRRAGASHAEVEALQAAGEQAQGGTLYVTLEPCNHYGRTPPCTEAIIKAGIVRIFYAVGDPNPNVTGKGGQRLAAANIVVHQGLCAVEARYLNRFYWYYVRTGRPYVVVKFAASLDGKNATRSGHSQWITGSESRQKGHALRNVVDAILVGAGTAIADNPRLTTRLSPHKDNGCHPLRVVLDSRGRVPVGARLFQADLPGQTLVAATVAMPHPHRTILKQKGVELLILPSTAAGRVDMPTLLAELGRRQITSLLVEGGGTVLGTFFEAGLVNEVWAFLAPLIIGGQEAPGAVGGRGCALLAEASHLQDISIETLGPDFLIRGFVNPLQERR